MRSTIILASIGATSASAVVPHTLPTPPRNASVSFPITLEAWSKGKSSGLIGQIADGQNRLGGNLPSGQFYFRRGPKGGELTDNHGRGCILTPQVQQFQCDEGRSPTPGFDVSCENALMYNGSREFWACPVNDHGVWNVYTRPVTHQKKCTPIEVSVHGNLGGEHKCRPAPPIPVLPPIPTAEKPITAAEKLKGNHGAQSPDGRCGAPTGFHCFGKSGGHCCSPHGWCGLTPLHCGSGCQSEYGVCGGSISHEKPAISSTLVKEASSSTLSQTKSYYSHPIPFETTFVLSTVSALTHGKPSSTKTPVKVSTSSTSEYAKPSPTKTPVKASTSSASEYAKPLPTKTPVKASTSSVSEHTKPSSSLTPVKASTSSVSEHAKPSFSSTSVKASTSSVAEHAKPLSTSAPLKSKLSPDGTCGGSTGFHCNGFGAGSCCGYTGWCGATPAHCGDGCQTSFGTCKSSTSSAPTSSSKLPEPTLTESYGNHSDSLVPMDCSSSESGTKCGSKYPGYGCPQNLDGEFQFAQRIVAVNRRHPDKALRTNFDNVTIGDDYCTLFNFAIDSKLEGRKCSLVWLFPEENAEGPQVSFSTKSKAPAVIEFWNLARNATEDSTWNSVGPRSIIAAGPVGPGISSTAKTVPCVPGDEPTFMVCGEHFHLEYSQLADFNPMGLYIRTC